MAGRGATFVEWNNPARHRQKTCPRRAVGMPPAASALGYSRPSLSGPRTALDPLHNWPLPARRDWPLLNSRAPWATDDSPTIHRGEDRRRSTNSPGRDDRDLAAGAAPLTRLWKDQYFTFRLPPFLRARALPSDWPVPCPRNWVRAVNAVQSDAELAALRRCVGPTRHNDAESAHRGFVTVLASTSKVRCES
jgi:hypothetical protein